MTTDIVLNTYSELSSIADAFVKSGMFADTKSQAQAIVKIIAGRELGLGPFYSISRINMIQGKLGLAAETLAALVKRSGKYDYKVIEHDDTKCSIEFTSNGKAVYVSTFTIEDARKAGLIKPGGGWEKYPRAMLFSRAISQGARIVAPECIGGAYTTEELQSIPAVAEEPEPPKLEVKEVKPDPKRLTAQQQAEATQQEPIRGITTDQINQLDALKKKGVNLKKFVDEWGWQVAKLSDLTELQAAKLIEVAGGLSSGHKTE